VGGAAIRVGKKRRGTRRRLKRKVQRPKFLTCRKKEGQLSAKQSKEKGWGHAQSTEKNLAKKKSYPGEAQKTRKEIEGGFGGRKSILGKGQRRWQKGIAAWGRKGNFSGNPCGGRKMREEN